MKVKTEGVGSLAALWRDWRIAQTLRKRCRRSEGRIIRRKSDRTLWVAGCPQNFAYAMSGLFTRKDSFHFYRAREWRGLLVASPKVFWRPQSGEFELLYDLVHFVLPRWPEVVECEKIDAQALTPTQERPK